MQSPFILPTQSDNRVKLRLDAEIVPAEKAQKNANIWLAMNAGHLLQSDNPELVFLPKTNTLHWRVEVWLTRIGSGQIAHIGNLDVNAQTGDVVDTPTLIKNLQHRANSAATN